MIKIFKHTKLPLFALILLVILALSPLSSALIAPAPTMPTSSEDKNKVPTTDSGIFFNGTDYLLKKGYTEKTIQGLDKDTAAKLILSSGGANLNKSIEEICMDLFGNSTGPFPLPNTQPVKSIVDKPIAEVSEPVEDEELLSQPLAVTYTSGTSACLIVAIWDYANGSDLGYGEEAYDATFYNAHMNGNYNWIQSLTNEGARHQYIWEWLAYLCYYYQYVDVYLFGHGASFFPGTFAGYCAFDYFDADGNRYPENVFCPQEIYSYYIHPYDFSSLRMGFGGFCGSFCFEDAFLYSLGFHVPNPNRVWLGSHFEQTDYYSMLMTNFFGYYWYHDDVDSLTARNQANVNSLYYYQLEWGPYTDDVIDHFASTGPIYYNNVCLLSIVAVNPWGLALDNAEIQIDYTTVGYGWAFLEVTPGWHHIDSSNPVYDYFLGYDIWIQSGTGDYNVGRGTTYVTIQYG
jgi:hypothetical protein